MDKKAKVILVVCFVLLTVCIGLLLLTSEASGEPASEEILPPWMTPEEILRAGEIGKDHKATDPPAGWVETPGEFEELRGVWITWIPNSYDYVFGEIVREVGEVCRAYVIVANVNGENWVRDYLTDHGIGREMARGLWISSTIGQDRKTMSFPNTSAPTGACRCTARPWSTPVAISWSMVWGPASPAT